MSTAVVYPATFPPPATMQVQGAERRAVAGMESAVPASARALQRDRQATATLAFKLDATQWAAWQVWWRLALGEGAAWFSAPTWVVPWGTGAVVQFTGQLQVTHLGAGLRQVEVQAQLRGASMSPQNVTLPVALSALSVDDETYTDHAAFILAAPGAVSILNGDWLRATSTGLQAVDRPAAVGVSLGALRGGAPAGQVHMRASADTAAALGRIGVVVNAASHAAALAALQAGSTTRTSHLTGADMTGYCHSFVWGEVVTSVHVGVVKLSGTYAVQASGACTGTQVLALTFDASDGVRQVTWWESAPTNHAGAPGTGSARFVSVRGAPLEA